MKMPTPADEWLAGDIPEEPLTPETLRLLLKEFEPLRGTVIATGDVEDGTDTSVSVGILIDDGLAHADQWEKDLNTAERLLVQLRPSYDGLGGIRRTQTRMEIEEFIARREAARSSDGG